MDRYEHNNKPMSEDDDDHEIRNNSEDEAEEDHKVDWSTIKVFVKSRPKTLDADAKLSEEDIFLIILEHTGEERARILANMAITVSKI